MGFGSARPEHRSGLLVAALLPVALLLSSAVAAAPAERRFDLSSQGVTEPYSLTGLADEATFTFTVPPDTADATLVLDLATDLTSVRAGTLAILINDQPRQTLALAAKRDSLHVDLPLTPGDLGGGTVAVTLRYRGALSDDACIDQRIAAAFLAIAPSSGLVVHQSAQPLDSLAATWADLPRQVRVALPARTLTPNQFGAALDLAVALKRTGHAVSFLRLPKIGDPLALDAADTRAWTSLTGAAPPATLADADALGVLLDTKALTAGDHAGQTPLADIVLASASEIDGLSAAAGRMLAAAPEAITASVKATGVPLEPLPETGGRNLGLRRIAGRPVIALTGEDAARPAVGFLTSPALPLARAPTLTVTGVHLPASAPPDGGVGLTDFLIGGAQRLMADRATFEARVSARDMPPGYQASGLAIDIVAPSPADEPAPLLQVLVNGMLVRAVRLTDSDQSQRVRVDFPDGLAGMDNRIKLVVQRRSAATSCAVAGPAYPVQILPSSAVLGSAASGPVTDFYQLPARLRGGMDLIISPQMLDRPGPVLGFASTLLLPLLAPGHAPSIVTSTTTTIPARPFITLVPEIKTTGGAVTADGNRLRVIGTDGTSLIDVAGVPAAAALQLVEAEKQPGLKVLRPDGQSWTEPPAISLDRGNVALVNETGVSLALTTHRDRLFRLGLTTMGHYRDLVDRYRYYLIGGGWLLATLLFFAVLRGALGRRGRS